MGKMTSFLSLRKGTPKQLKDYLDQSSEIKAAYHEGLEDLQVLQDPDDPKRAEILTVWRNIDAIKKYRANNQGTVLSGLQVIVSAGLEADVESTTLRTAGLI
jgi:hypothetical protein